MVGEVGDVAANMENRTDHGRFVHFESSQSGVETSWDNFSATQDVRIDLGLIWLGQASTACLHVAHVDRLKLLRHQCCASPR